MRKFHCVGMMVLLACLSTAQGTTTNFIVTRELASTRPVSPVFVGAALEPGHGMQVEGMWAEMLFNRSFEQFPPYRTNNIEWADLWLDPSDPSKGYKTEWVRESWYHSGYEHNPWFAAPGDGRTVPIDDKSVFMVATTPLAKVDLRRQTEPGRHGAQQLRVRNQEEKSWGGLAQSGKYLRKGSTYEFRGMLRAFGGTVRPEIRFYAANDWSKPIAVVKLEQVGERWTERVAKIPNPDFQGMATFALWLPPGSEIAVDNFSLMPSDNFAGWRRDVIEPLRRISPRLIKFPGGNSASFYNWRNGIGERSSRTPQPSWFWGGFDYNDVGVAEYATLCRSIGAEMLWTVNVFHPAKARFEAHWGQGGPTPGSHGQDFSQFTDVEQGAREAANLVAYCNRSAGLHPMADLRARHGYPRPFEIRYWELDVDAFRWFEPEEYAQAAVLYAKAMKAVDSSIKIGIGVYGHRLDEAGQQRVVFQDAIGKMLAIAGKHIDFIADRGTADPEYLQRVTGLLDRYNSENKTSIRYADTGKMFYEPQASVPNIPEISKWNSTSMGGTWFYAMKAVKDYLVYQREGGDIETVVFSSLANNYNLSLLNTPRQGVFLSGAGVAMSVLANSPAAWPLKFDGYQPEPDAEFRVSAALDGSKKHLVLFVYNRTGLPRSATFDLSKLERRFQRAELTRVWSDHPLNKNTLESPLRIRHNITVEPVSRSQSLHTIEVEPWSFVQAVLQ